MNWFAEKPGKTNGKNHGPIGIKRWIPNICKSFEILIKFQVGFNHNGGMEKVMWEKIMEILCI